MVNTRGERKSERFREIQSRARMDNKCSSFVLMHCKSSGRHPVTRITFNVCNHLRVVENDNTVEGDASSVRLRVRGTVAAVSLLLFAIHCRELWRRQQ